MLYRHMNRAILTIPPTTPILDQTRHLITTRKVGSMRRFVLTQLLVIVLCTPTFADVIRGNVQDVNGRPIAGARVDISTAAPKQGPNLFCPSCYLDCAKSTSTDDQGRFEFQSVDDFLRFRLVATAPGKQTALTDLVDPSHEVASITLADFPSDLAANRVLQGTVLSMEGAPVSGALVAPRGAKAAHGHWLGRVKGATPAVTDDEGRFRMFLSEDYLGVDLEVTAYGYAGAIAMLATPGESDHTIRIPVGATVKGRLVHRKMAVSDLPIAVVQVNRALHDRPFLKAVLSKTSWDGSFQFQALPADETYAIFSPVGLRVDGPVVRTTLFTAGKNNEARDLGTLELIPGLTFKGTIRMSGRDTPPSDLRMTLHRRPAWDLVEVPIKANGRFRIDNLPPESYEVRIRTKAARLDDINYQVLGTHSFAVRLTDSLTDFVIPLRVFEGRGAGRNSRPTQSVVSGRQRLTGKVVDRSGKPVAGIRITPYLIGNGRRRGSITSSGTDGGFLLTDLPDEPIELKFYRPGAFGYPMGSGGTSILYPGRVRPKLNQSDVVIVFDPTLIERPPNLH